jgi:hypothetical protein
MSKVIEFTVEISQVGTRRTKSKKFLAKSLNRLISSMPKPLKRKWKTITYIENGISKTVENE